MAAAASMNPDEEQRRRNVRLGLILATVALAFLVGAVVRFALFKG